jgi:hypothetical protein
LHYRPHTFSHQCSNRSLHGGHRAALLLIEKRGRIEWQGGGNVLFPVRRLILEMAGEEVPRQ